MGCFRGLGLVCWPLGLPHFNAKECMCWLCKGNRVDFDYTDMSKFALWMGTLWTVSNGGLDPPSDNPLLTVTGVTRFSHIPDWMHTSCEGVVKWAIGSSLFAMVFDAGHVLPPQAILDDLWKEINALYSQLHITSTLTNLKMSMFCLPTSPWSEFPCLRCSASEARCLILVMLQLCQAHNTNSDRDMHMCALFEHLD